MVYKFGELKNVFAYLLLPYRVIGKIKPHAFVLMVGVDPACAFAESGCPIVLFLSAALVQSAAASNIFTTATYPLGSGTHIVEDAICTVIAYSDNLFPTAASRIRPSVYISVLVEVFPPFGGSPLAFLRHPFLPLAAFVLWLMAFHKLAVAWVDSRPIGRDV